MKNRTPCPRGFSTTSVVISIRNVVRIKDLTESFVRRPRVFRIRDDVDGQRGAIRENGEQMRDSDRINWTDDNIHHEVTCVLADTTVPGLFLLVPRLDHLDGCITGICFCVGVHDYDFQVHHLADDLLEIFVHCLRFGKADCCGIHNFSFLELWFMCT